jgi:superfamily I DNA/RNA helicase
MEKARRLAEEGFRVLLTCYNRPLADYLRRSAGPVERLRILNFHQLCWELAEQAGIPLPDPHAVPVPPELFTSTLPNALLDALDRIEDRFDAVVVDEGQDFLDTWWDPLQLCLADQDRAVLYVFHDDNQQLYRRVPTFPRGLVEIILHDNLRNTQRIHAAISKFYHGEALRAAGPEGRDVEWIAAGSTLEIEQALSRVLHRLVREESVAPADIVVLVSSSRTGPLKKDSVVGVFELTGDQNAEPGKVLLESIRRFKGLERQVVIVAGIDDLVPEDENGMLYVALSRARAHLVVIATAGTISRCQVPNVARSGREPSR